MTSEPASIKTVGLVSLVLIAFIPLTNLTWGFHGTESVVPFMHYLSLVISPVL